MQTTELFKLLAKGEDGKQQFKANISNQQALASEIDLGGLKRQARQETEMKIF